MGKLTALKVKSLTTPGRYGDGDGLYLKIRSPTRRSWLLRFMRAGRAREMGLGSADVVSLADARLAAHQARKQLRDGSDPLDIRKQATQARIIIAGETFEKVAELYVGAHEAGWRNVKHAAQWRATLARAQKAFGSRGVADVDTDSIMALLEPMWRATPETASRLRGRIEVVLDYAKARGWRDGDNPARWRGHLSNLLPARSKVRRVRHHPALPWHEIGEFMYRLRDEKGAAARALEWTILTAARTGETLGMVLSEVDVKAKIWTVPFERMKGGREHRVPLSDDALSVFAEMRLAMSGAPQQHVFQSGDRARGRPMSGMAMAMLLRRMDHGGITVHGFRSTFRDWCAEATSIQREVAEAALAHTLRDKVEAAYRRGDMFEKRRALMEDWANFCGRSPEAAQVEKITS